MADYRDYAAEEYWAKLRQKAMDDDVEMLESVGFTKRQAIVLRQMFNRSDVIVQLPTSLTEFME